MKPKHKVHPSVVLAAKAIYAECFSPDGKPAHKKLARQMEATMERVLGVSKLHDERNEILKFWTRSENAKSEAFDRIFPHVAINRR